MGITGGGSLVGSIFHARRDDGKVPSDIPPCSMLSTTQQSYLIHLKGVCAVI